MQSVDDGDRYAVRKRHGGEAAMIMEDIEGISLFGHLVDNIENPGHVIGFKEGLPNVIRMGSGQHLANRGRGTRSGCSEEGDAVP